MVLPKIINAGIYNSQFAAKNVKISSPRQTKHFEIELPLEPGGISYIDSDSIPISTDIIICAKPGQTRHTKFPYKCYCVHLKLDDDILYKKLMDVPLCIRTLKTDKYKQIFSEIIKHYNTGDDNDEIMLQGLILQLIYTVIRDTEKIIFETKVKGAKYLVVKEITQYIKNHLSSDLSLEKMAELAHLSPIYFHNAFKTVMGKTLREYVEEQRLKKALDLLTTTDYSLTKIAFECGFSSQSYFSMVFKRRLNKSPGEYVKEFFNRYTL